jgi:hypothetical protein
MVAGWRCELVAVEPLWPVADTSQEAFITVLKMDR